jgi:hypothetical protein
MQRLSMGLLGSHIAARNDHAEDGREKHGSGANSPQQWRQTIFIHVVLACPPINRSWNFRRPPFVRACGSRFLSTITIGIFGKCLGDIFLIMPIFGHQSNRQILD